MFEVRGFVLRGALREITLVRHTSDDREPPRVRLELQSVSGRDDVDDLVGVDVRNAAVAIADSQVQRVTREQPHGEDELEFLTRGRVEIVASQHLFYRLPAPEDLGFLVTGAQDVAGRAGGERRTEGQQAQCNRQFRDTRARRAHHFAAPAAAGVSVGTYSRPRVCNACSRAYNPPRSSSSWCVPISRISP